MHSTFLVSMLLLILPILVAAAPTGGTGPGTEYIPLGNGNVVPVQNTENGSGACFNADGSSCGFGASTSGSDDGA